MNKIILKGRLVRNPELKTGANGTEFCKFSVAVDRRQSKDKEKVTDFFDCTAFGNTGAAISKYMEKGREILIEGRMESNRVAKDERTVTYWGVTVETFDFCGSRNEAKQDAPAPALDAESGMAVVDTESLPF